MKPKIHSQSPCLVLAVAMLGLVSCKNRSSGGSDGPGCDADECKLTASDAHMGALFGGAIAMDGDRLAVAALQDDEAAAAAGAVYILQRDGSQWVEDQKLVATDASALLRLGNAVALDGSLAVAAARTADDNGTGAGAVYVFRRAGGVWTQEQKLLASDGEADDGFGASVAVSGDVIAVGASGDDDAGSEAGAVYVFRFGGVTWAEEEKLTAADGAAGDRFGRAVGTDGTVISVGAPHDDGPTDSGSGYVFRYNGATWDEEARIVALRAPLTCQTQVPQPDKNRLDYFGSSTAIDGDLVAFGGPNSALRGQPSNGNCSLATTSSFVGAVYLYRFDGGSTWDFEARLADQEGTARQYLGASAAINNAEGVVVGGAPGDQANGPSAGAGFIFRYDAMAAEWSAGEKVLPSDGVTYDAFGASAAIDGDDAAFGATGDGDAGVLSGSVYVYPL
ncbi:MAG: hypothetical protein GY944_22620 [bacterium]|nr:hypothetical protein [bacterium]